MEAYRQHVQEFLTAEGLDSAGLDAEAVLDRFLAEMGRGVARTGAAAPPGALGMIPTFLHTDHPVERDATAIVMDAGGTHLRIGTARFGEDGAPSIAVVRRERMPGIDRELSADAFFERLAEYLLPLADRADRIGFCFSYPTEMFPDRDGRLIHWTKEVKAPEVEGRLIGASLLDRLARHGYRPRITLLNDTVATLLAARGTKEAEEGGATVGLILGTGMNAAYVEPNRNIRKRTDLPREGTQVINIEAGGFGAVPAAAIDHIVDAQTDDPGRYRLEKMVSGAYRGNLCLALLRRAADAGLFSRPAADAVRAMPELSPITVTEYLNRPLADGPFAGAPFTDMDRRACYLLFDAIVERAAILMAVVIAATAVRSGEPDPLRPVCVNVDGSTFHKVRGFQARVERRLFRLLDPRGRRTLLIHLPESPLTGAAVAALSQTP